jgi:predicted glutamine amidotransferase
MCRFLLLTISAPCDLRSFVVQFAEMCQHSTGLSGEGWQGDGWGVAWRDDYDAWQVQHSIAPIWTETHRLQAIPPTRHLLAHARSASFSHHKGNIALSQPYVSGPYAFVFNGFLKGVRLPRRLPGTIGAEKIWALVREKLAQGDSLAQALETVYTVLARHSRDIQACNLGVSDGHTYAWYNGNPHGQAYYQLQQSRVGALQIVCSEPFGPWTWQPAASTSAQARPQSCR